MSQIKQTLSTMTTREKLEHIWTYYKLHIIGAVVLIVLLIVWGSNLYAQSKEILLQGELINVTVTDAGYQYLAEESFSALGGSNRRQTVNIGKTFSKDPALDNAAYLQQLKLIAQIEGQNLDFLILSESLFQDYAVSDFYMDLRECFSEDELTDLGNAIAYTHSEYIGGIYPAGIRLDDTEFAKACLSGDTPYYLVFIANTPHLPACRAFWTHILNY